MLGAPDLYITLIFKYRIYYLNIPSIGKHKMFT